MQKGDVCSRTVHRNEDEDEDEDEDSWEDEIGTQRSRFLSIWRVEGFGSRL